jgi:hypothetical protein
VAVVSPGGVSSPQAILLNAIFANGGLGIDLGDDGVTPNDAMDTDTGPDALQNYPILSSAVATGTVVLAHGALHSEPNKTFRIEYFASEMADPSGYGEGQTFLGTENVTTDSNGDAGLGTGLFIGPLPPFGQNFITATATDSAAMANTSEFSRAIRLETSPDRLLNISTRMRVLTGDNVLIGGVIITGSDPLPAVLRAVGPSMKVNGMPVAGVLQDPTLTLYDASGSEIAFNDNWGDAPEPERTLIELSGAAPEDPREPAMYRNLPVGAYTAIVRGKNATTGLALVEIYDKTPLPIIRAAEIETPVLNNSHLVNLSTRGLCSTDNNIMISGVIVNRYSGGGARILARGIGPSLAVAGTPVPGRLADPMLALFDAQGTEIAENNDWRTTQEQEIETTGLAPTDDREAAILTTLPPGMATVQLRGNANSTGIALIEVYELPPAPTE